MAGVIFVAAFVTSMRTGTPIHRLIDAPPGQEEDPIPDDPGRGAVLAGRDAVIDSPEPGRMACVAVDAVAWEEMVAAQVAGNAALLGDLAAEGRVFLLADGQAVRVRERAYASARVSVVGGPSDGRSGWVQLRCLIPR